MLILAFTELSERSTLDEELESEFELVLRILSRLSTLEEERDKAMLDA